MGQAKEHMSHIGITVEHDVIVEHVPLCASNETIARQSRINTRSKLYILPTK